MWHSIEKQLSDVLDQPILLQVKQPASGGDINSCYVITVKDQDNKANLRFFIKINQRSRSDMFQQEAYSLSHLADRNALYIPEVICHGITRENSYLVLEYLEFSSPKKDDWFSFGAGLAKLHQSTAQAKFGWDEDNFIGSSPQPNAWHAHWDTFFAEERIGWQLQLAAEKQIRFGDIDKLVDCAKAILYRHKPYPALVHGDLWRGNIAFKNGQPTIFDPACYYADREVDLAMTELFGAFPTEFYQGYEQALPLADGYKRRKALYNLYHLLNHANLFGGHYIDQVRQTIKQILL